MKIPSWILRRKVYRVSHYQELGYCSVCERDSGEWLLCMGGWDNSGGLYTCLHCGGRQSVITRRRACRMQEKTLLFNRFRIWSHGKWTKYTRELES